MASMTTLKTGTSGQKFDLKSKLVILDKRLNGTARSCWNQTRTSKRHANLARSSQLAADCRVRRLNTFYKNTWITPAEMIATGKNSSMNAEDMILDYVTWMEAQKYASGYIEGVVTSQMKLIKLG